MSVFQVLRREAREGGQGKEGWLTSMTGTGDAFSLSRAWYFSRSACGRSSEKKSSLQAVGFFTKFLVIMLLQGSVTAVSLCCHRAVVYAPWQQG